MERCNSFRGGDLHVQHQSINEDESSQTPLRKPGRPRKALPQSPTAHQSQPQSSKTKDASALDLEQESLSRPKSQPSPSQSKLQSSSALPKVQTSPTLSRTLTQSSSSQSKDSEESEKLHDSRPTRKTLKPSARQPKASKLDNSSRSKALKMLDDLPDLKGKFSAPREGVSAQSSTTNVSDVASQVKLSWKTSKKAQPKKIRASPSV